MRAFRLKKACEALLAANNTMMPATRHPEAITSGGPTIAGVVNEAAPRNRSASDKAPTEAQ